MPRAEFSFKCERSAIMKVYSSSAIDGYYMLSHKIEDGVAEFSIPSMMLRKHEARHLIGGMLKLVNHAGRMVGRDFRGGGGAYLFVPKNDGKAWMWLSKAWLYAVTVDIDDKYLHVPEITGDAGTILRVKKLVQDMIRARSVWRRPFKMPLFFGRGR